MLTSNGQTDGQHQSIGQHCFAIRPKIKCDLLTNEQTTLMYDSLTNCKESSSQIKAVPKHHYMPLLRVQVKLAQGKRGFMAFLTLCEQMTWMTTQFGMSNMWLRRCSKAP